MYSKVDSYKCVFNFFGIYFYNRPREVTYDGDGIHAYTQGFWITNELKFTKGSDCKYWIPPSQILYIEKVVLPSQQRRCEEEQVDA